MTDKYFIHSELAKFGWDKFFADDFEANKKDNWIPGRIFAEHKNSFEMFTASGEMNAVLSGKLRRHFELQGNRPVVGDWVAVMIPDDTGPGIIQYILRRKSCFSRQVSSGRKSFSEKVEEQIIAANADIVFIVSGLDREFNPRRIERYLTLVFEGGASPVIILNKSDLLDRPETFLKEIESISFGTPLHCISVKTRSGLGELQHYFSNGKTVAMLGSSGVGKSSLINFFLGEERQEVREISDAVGKGKHTTSRREIILLPGGGLVMDNPGMREIQLWADENTVNETYSEIEKLAQNCYFADCRHISEPKCAVKRAIESGELEEARYQSYLKQKKEVEYLKKKTFMSANAIEKDRWKKFMKK